MKTLFKVLLAPMSNRKRFQRVFENLLKLSLKGMNIGGGTSPKNSGEIATLKYIYRKLQGANDLTIFDVGANIGEYSILLKDIFKDKAHIYAFEPSKKTYEKFLSTTQHLTNISHYNIGLGNENATITLYSNADESGLASVYDRKLDHFNIKMDKKELVAIKTIDGFCAENNINHIHFLKLDVEGHEMKVLEGAKNMINSKKVDFIQFEFGGTNIDSRTYFRDFFDLLKDEYYLYRIVGDGLYPIKKYSEMLEIFTTTNFIAERIGM
jgi:FkbM family methyltransferase